MHLIIAKVDETYFDGEADSLTVTGVSGEMTILPNHMPLITTTKPCTAVIRAGGKTKEIDIEDGVLEVRREGVTILL